MQRNTSVILGEHFANFIQSKIEQGRYESVSEAVRSALRLLEIEEAKLDALREKLAVGEEQLKNGQWVDGETAFNEMMQRLQDGDV